MLTRKRVSMQAVAAHTIHKMIAFHTPGDRVRYMRDRRKLSALELANRAGMTRSAIYQIESGATKAPTPAHLFSIAKALSCNPEWLATGAGTPDVVREVKPTGRGQLVTVHFVMIDTHNKKPVWRIDRSSPVLVPSSVLEDIELADETAAAIDAPDDAMARTISAGDRVIVDTADRALRDNRVYAMLYGGRDRSASRLPRPRWVDRAVAG